MTRNRRGRQLQRAMKADPALNRPPCWQDGPLEREDDGPAPGDECGRWSNGRLTRHCAKAGSEECEFECPFSGVTHDAYPEARHA